MKRWILIGVMMLGACFGQERLEEAEDGDVPVPVELLEGYFADRPSGFLLDPQDLLAPRAREDREKFLRYHSEDSQIDFRVLLFDKGQSLPGEIRLEELGERFAVEGKPTLIALYFLGEPDRTLLEFSPDLREKISPADANRVLVQAVRTASEKSNVSDQFEAFCVQMAIRIYWVEQAVGLTAAEPPAEGETREPVSVSGAEERPTWKARFSEGFAQVGVPAVVLVMAVLAGAVARWLIRRREVFTFPVKACEGRLGGGHGAGIGSVVSFGDSGVSPTTQRAQTRDTLGGI